MRIDLQSSGCCDAALDIRIDEIHDDDLMEDIDGLIFLISLETHCIVGNASISYRDEADHKGFVITSENPVSEWDGFGMCEIKV